jgi:hypothetical protein
MLNPESPEFSAAMMVVTVIGLLILTCRCLRTRGIPQQPAVTAIGRTMVLGPTGLPGTCTVCLDDMRSGDRVAVLRCDHRFHHDCVMPWLLHCNSCPLCRTAGPTEV